MPYNVPHIYGILAVTMAAPKHSLRSSGKVSHGVTAGTKSPRKAKAAAGKTAVKSANQSMKAVGKKIHSGEDRKIDPKTARVVSHEGLLRGGDLVTHFLNREGLVNVERVVKRFGMSKQQLAETMGVSPETVYRSSRASAPKTQTRATEMLEIVGRIVDWAGGEKQAMAWYRAEPIAAFGGRTAESLVKEGKAAAVRDYLDRIATGGFV